MSDIFQKYISMLIDADYTTKIQPACTEKMSRLDELRTKLENIKIMDLDTKD